MANSRRYFDAIDANAAGKPEFGVPYSRLKAEVAGVLKREGYIADFYAEKRPNGVQDLKVQLKVLGKERAIVGIRRISRPGLRKMRSGMPIFPTS